MTRSGDYDSEVATVSSGANCVDIAEQMDRHTVGCVVVADAGVPRGIVTDRDLVCRVLAEGRDPEKVLACDVMSEDLVTCSRDDDIEAVLKKMGEKGIRRVPLVDEDGQLVSILSLDDLIRQISSYLFNYTQSMLHGLQESRRVSRGRRRRESWENSFDDVRRQLTEFGEQTRTRVKSELQDLLDRF